MNDSKGNKVTDIDLNENGINDIEEFGESGQLDTVVRLLDGILCPFCGKKPQEYQGSYTDGEGNKNWEVMVQCQTKNCVVEGRCFTQKKWLIRAGK